MARHHFVPGPHSPYSPDLANADFYLFERLKQQLSGRILDSKKNVAETVTGILRELNKHEVKSVLCLKGKMVVGRGPELRALFEWPKCPHTLILFRLIGELGT
jgi:hypothetical protein